MSSTNETFIQIVAEGALSIEDVQHLLGASQRGVYSWLATSSSKRIMPAGELERLAMILARTGRKTPTVTAVLMTIDQRLQGAR